MSFVPLFLFYQSVCIYIVLSLRYFQFFIHVTSFHIRHCCLFPCRLLCWQELFFIHLTSVSTSIRSFATSFTFRLSCTSCFYHSCLLWVLHGLSDCPVTFQAVLAIFAFVSHGLTTCWHWMFFSNLQLLIILLFLYPFCFISSICTYTLIHNWILNSYRYKFLN